MPDLPNDPRLLAQEILAGRVSIQDLAREQARRRAAQANSANVTNAEKTGNPQPRPPATTRPSTGPYPPPTRKATPPNRPVNLKPVPSSARPTVPVRKPAVPVRANPTPAKSPPARTGAPPQGAPSAPAQSVPKKAPQPGVVRSAKDRELRQVIRRVLASPQNTRTVYLISELLAPPIALRQPPWPDSPPRGPQR